MAVIHPAIKKVLYSPGTNWKLRFLGLTSGLLFMITHLMPETVPLQLVALIPLLYGLSRRNGSLYMAGTMGIYFALGFTFPQVFVLKLWAGISIPLTLYFCLLYSLFALGAAWLLDRQSVASALGIAALMVVTDWVNVTALPMWGTAQSLARPWSAYPALIQFVCYSGITGIIFFVTGAQALVITGLLHSGRMVSCGLALIILAAVYGVMNYLPSREQPVGSVRVAAMGWTTDVSPSAIDDRDISAEQFFEEAVSNAAAHGAKIITSPELVFIYDGLNNGWTELFSRIARTYGEVLVVGYRDFPDHKNRAFLMDTGGVIRTEHTKTHLTPVETFNKGDGSIHTIETDGIRVGAMICQDDNFTDLSRRMGAADVAVVGVPTLDWEPIRKSHFQNGIHRAIESRYAVMRAACNGISAIISPRGEVLAKKDHYEEGSGIVWADVPIYKTKTLYSRFGNWLPLVCGIYLIVIAAMGIRWKNG